MRHGRHQGSDRAITPDGAAARLVTAPGRDLLGLFALAGLGIADVTETYGDPFAGGWWEVWALVGLAASGAATGAILLWAPRRPAIAVRVLFWVAGALAVVLVSRLLLGVP